MGEGCWMGMERVTRPTRVSLVLFGVYRLLFPFFFFCFSAMRVARNAAVRFGVVFPSLGFAAPPRRASSFFEAPHRSWIGEGLLLLLLQCIPVQYVVDARQGLRLSCLPETPPSIRVCGGGGTRRARSSRRRRKAHRHRPLSVGSLGIPFFRLRLAMGRRGGGEERPRTHGRRRRPRPPDFGRRR